MIDIEDVLSNILSKEINYEINKQILQSIMNDVFIIRRDKLKNVLIKIDENKKPSE